MDLVDIKSEASRLKKSKAGAPPAATAEDELRALQKKFERGALTAEDYGKEKSKVLERIR